MVPLTESAAETVNTGDVRATLERRHAALSPLIGGRREGSLTHHGGGGEQLAVAGLLPAVLERTGALAGFALEHDVLALLRGAVGVAPGLRGLHCGRAKRRLEESGGRVMADVLQWLIIFHHWGRSRARCVNQRLSTDGSRLSEGH